MKKLILNYRKLLPLSRQYCSEYPIQANAITEEWTRKLKKANFKEDVDLTFKCILSYVLKKDVKTLPNLDKLHLTEEEVNTFERLCECRISRVPMAYILGEMQFMDMKLKMSPTVYIPRPETKEFIQFVLKDPICKKPDLKILDVGSGTGPICMALLKNMANSTATALDRSRIATEVTMDNARLFKLNDRLTVFCHTVKENELLPELIKNAKYDLIVSNPPSIKSSELAKLDPESKLYENQAALDGGPDGLSIARIVCSLAVGHLEAGGKLWIQLHPDQTPLFKQFAKMRLSMALQVVSCYKDSLRKSEQFVEMLKL